MPGAQHLLMKIVETTATVATLPPSMLSIPLAAPCTPASLGAHAKPVVQMQWFSAKETGRNLTKL